MRLYVTLAELLKTPVAVLLHVPHQPIFDGKHEDAAIAYTFDEYLRPRTPSGRCCCPWSRPLSVAWTWRSSPAANGRWTWHVHRHRPRTRLDHVADVHGFTSGCTALVPMVIDVLNMGPDGYQEEVWGRPSEQIRDYTERGMHRKLQSDEGQSLVAIVDPYQYREKLNQPKLVILGTNDPYWPVDALNLYWQQTSSCQYRFSASTGQ